MKNEKHLVKCYLEMDEVLSIFEKMYLEHPRGKQGANLKEFLALVEFCLDISESELNFDKWLDCWFYDSSRGSFEDFIQEGETESEMIERMQDNALFIDYENRYIVEYF